MTEHVSRLRAVLGVAMVCGITLSLTSMAYCQGWPMGGQNLQNSRSQSDTTITPENVGTLKQKWVFTTGGDVSATPAVHDGTVYFPDFAGNFYAVNAKTGALQWSRTVSSWTGASGDYARNDPAISGDTLILGDQAGALATWTQAGGLTGAGARVIAVNRLTGALIWSTQVEAFPAAFITGSPVIYKGVVYVGVASGEEHTAATAGYPCCTSSGSVVALGLRHGKILWKTYMAPSGYSGASVWGSTPVIDATRNSVYVGTGDNFSAPQVVETCFANNQNNPNCVASNDYFNSVVALDLTTGQVKWATHALYYDTWNVSCSQGGAGAATVRRRKVRTMILAAAARTCLGRISSESVRRAASIGRWIPTTDMSSGKPRLGPGAWPAASSGAPHSTEPASTFRSQTRAILATPFSPGARR